MKTTGEMSIHQCERLAKKAGYDSMKFTALFPVGPTLCRWVDAYMGIFVIESDESGFLMTNQIDDAFPDLVCIPESESEVA